MLQAAGGFQEQVIHPHKGKPADMADRKGQPAMGAQQVGFIHKFGAIHMIIAGKIKFHIKHDTGLVKTLYGAHQGFLFGHSQGKTKNTNAAVAVGIGKNCKGIPPDPLIGIPFSSQGMINKEAVVFQAGNSAVRIGLIALVEAPQAITGKITAGTGYQVAGFYLALDAAELTEGAFGSLHGSHRIFPGYHPVLVGGTLLAGSKPKKKEAAGKPPPVMNKKLIRRYKHAAKL